MANRRTKYKRKYLHALAHPVAPKTLVQSLLRLGKTRLTKKNSQATAGDTCVPALVPARTSSNVSSHSSPTRLPSSPCKYLASQPKSNPWGSGAVVHGPMVNIQAEDRLDQPIQPFGGLRLMAGTMSRLTYEVELGGRINECIRTVFEENPTMVTDVLAHIGRENCTAIDESIIAKVKPKLKQLLLAACPTFQSTPATETTVMDAELLDLWRSAAKDPDTEPPK